MANVSAWLDETVSGCGLTTAQHCAKYWICKARLQEQQTEQDSSQVNQVINIYEQAVRSQVKVRNMHISEMIDVLGHDFAL